MSLLLCANACGRKVGLHQHLCHECAAGIMHYRETYDGPTDSMEDDSLIVAACARALGAGMMTC